MPRKKRIRAPLKQEASYKSGRTQFVGSTHDVSKYAMREQRYRYIFRGLIVAVALAMSLLFPPEKIMHLLLHLLSKLP